MVIAAHGNSLRALVKYLDDVSDAAIVELNIPTGIPLVYELDAGLKPLKHYYLGNAAEVEAKCRIRRVRLDRQSAHSPLTRERRLGRHRGPALGPGLVRGRCCQPPGAKPTLRRTRCARWAGQRIVRAVGARFAIGTVTPLDRNPFASTTTVAVPTTAS